METKEFLNIIKSFVKTEKVKKEDRGGICMLLKNEFILLERKDLNLKQTGKVEHMWYMTLRQDSTLK